MTKKIFTAAVALMFAVAISNAQSIPNAGFESWTSMTGYDNPDSWTCLNGMTASASTYTCMKGTPGSPGTSYLKLVSKTVTGMGVMPGIASSGTFDQSTFAPLTGFAFNQRPANLTGKWQHMIYGSSQGYVDIQLTRWDAGMNMRMPVASAHQVLSGMAMSWANFTIPLTYVDGSNPDSCMITFSASGSTPTANDYLYIDNLAFSGSVTGIAENHLAASISVYPNPASENLILDLSALKDKNVSVQVIDITGKQVQAVNNINVSSNTSLDISKLPLGTYVLNIISKEGTIQKNFIKQ